MKTQRETQVRIRADVHREVRRGIRPMLRRAAGAFDCSLLRGSAPSLLVRHSFAPGADRVEASLGLGCVLVEAGKSRTAVVRAGGAVLKLA